MTDSHPNERAHRNMVYGAPTASGRFDFGDQYDHEPLTLETITELHDRDELRGPPELHPSLDGYLNQFEEFAHEWGTRVRFAGNQGGAGEDVFSFFDTVYFVTDGVFTEVDLKRMVRDLGEFTSVYSVTFRDIEGDETLRLFWD